MAAAPAPPLARGRTAGAPGRREAVTRLARRVPIGPAVFVAALAARLTVILRHNGLHGSFGYDAAVYFGAADALTRGRLPYRDFVLLHPPGLMLALSPFAALTRVMSDEWAFTVANLSFAVLGAVNAYLVVRVCRRLGLGRRQAAVGGLFYALWFGAVGAEYLSKLEPLGNFVLLVAILAGLRAHERGRLRSFALAGLPLGVVISVKIWWIVPVIALLVWHAVRARRARPVAALLGGLLTATLVIDLPFFIAAPKAMWSSVIQDQLGRHPNAVSPLIRLGDLSSVPRLTGPLPTPALAIVSALFVVLAATVVRAAWRTPVARPGVLLLLVQAVVVLVSPSWFSFYCDYLAVAAALTVAAASRPRPVGAADRWWTRLPAGRLATGTAALITVVTLAVGASTVRPFQGATTLSRSVASVPCVMSDSPMGQIELDALSRGLAHGCRNWIDVTGRTYGPDYANTSRVANTRWQRDLRGYLRSGGAVIIVRGAGTGLDPATEAAVRADGVLARAGGHAVYRVVR